MSTWALVEALSLQQSCSRAATEHATTSKASNVSTWASCRSSFVRQWQHMCFCPSKASTYVLVKQVKQVRGPLVGALSMQQSCNRAATELQQSMQQLVKQVKQVLGPLVEALSHALRGEFASVAARSPWTRGQSAVALLQQHL